MIGLLSSAGRPKVCAIMIAGRRVACPADVAVDLLVGAQVRGLDRTCWGLAFDNGWR